MAEVSEYQRNFQPFAFSERSRMKSGDQIAGLSSMDLAVAREPPLQHKRRSHLEPSNKMPAGSSSIAKANQKTEYQLQYDKKDPLLEPSPLLAADLFKRSGEVPAAGKPSRNIAFQDVVKEPILPVPPSKARPKTAPLTKEHSEERGETGDSGVGEEIHDEQDCHEIQESSPITKDGSVSLKDGKKIKKSRHSRSHRHHHHHHHHCRCSHNRCHHSHHRPKKIRVPMSTEYRDKYREWPIVFARKHEEVANSKETGSPAVLPPAGSLAKLHSPSDMRLQRHSPIKTALPIANNIPTTSEYQSNYQSPTHKRYVRGAWLGAPRPELLLKKDDEEAVTPDIDESWYTQVKELRLKTDEYKKRSQGSYFSRDYLDLLEQKQLELLEAASDSASLRSSCDACSICYGSGSSRSDSLHDDMVQVEDLEEITGVKQHKTFSLGKGVKQHKTFSLGKGVKQQNAKNQQVLTSATKTVQVPEDAVNMGEGEGEMEMPSSEASDISRGTSEKVLKLNKSRPVLIDQPRPSTPELKGKSQWGTRHHLNLTTPVNNGFFSPSKRDPVQVNRTESISGKYRRDLKSRAPIFPSKQAHTINIPTLSFDEGLRDESNKKRVVHKLPTDGRRPGGQATRRKGETLKELYMEETEDGMMCNICGADLDQSKLVSKNCKRGSALHKKADIYRNGGSPLLRMPEQDQSKPADWDTLSSISASSCSVASEILERAKIRKEKFWQE